ncbi:MAG: NAD-dependent epimerase/dehydratase family protein [Deltaproteobacteria bacterium]
MRSHISGGILATLDRRPWRCAFEGPERMRVLITGGAGFIGSNLVREWLRRGADVTVFDNLASMCSLRLIDDVADDVRFVHGDIRSPEDLGKLPTGPFDRVYHLAASFANELSVEYPTVDIRTNAEGTLNVLTHAQRAGCGLFVYTGSSSSYGDAPVPMREDGPTRPHTPYAHSKQLGESHVLASNLPHVVFRLFNVYGPGDTPGRYRNAIPNMFHALDDEGARLRVFGEHATRDFTYVDDAVRFLAAAERARGELVNLASGVETRMVDLVPRILSLRNRPSNNVGLEPARPWDRVTRRCADVTKLRALYGEVPSTPLADGLERTHGWLLANRYLREGSA